MNISTQPHTNRPASKRWVITITTLLALAMFPAAYLLNKKSNEMQADLKKYSEPVEEVEEELEEEESVMQKSIIIDQFEVLLPDQKIPTVIKVYWNKENIYLLINSLPKLSVGEKYEVSSISDGKRNSLGLFDAPGADRLIIKRDNVSMTDTYDIKIVKGESPVPALENKDK